ncbi:MAG: hypothetical protein A4E30_00315 [Methanomassiliicoccales archaeon PtaB.Bin215]|nr:MAG: hypothetical protein A4E30_00315 [Methanomassiliicoccales archaeon PtaB.Bin215]
MGAPGAKQGILHSIRSRLGFSSLIDKRYDGQVRPRDPITLTVSTHESKPWTQYAKVKYELERRTELWNLSIANGPASVILDAYEHACFTNGWKIESDDENLAEAITKRIQKMHAELEIRKMFSDGLRFGYGIAERGQTQAIIPRLTLVTRCARQFDVVQNSRGFNVAVRQYNSQGKAIIELPIEKAVVLMPIVTSEGMGKSLLEQCYGPLIWWDKVNTSSADAIYRHGYPVFDIQVQGPDGKLAPIDVMTGAEAVTTDLNPNSELITNALTQIKELNAGGVPNVSAYGEWVLQQICASSGVPEELFGLGRGNTGLLAASKWAIFYDKIASIQHTLEPQLDDQVVDVIAVEEGGAPGDAHWSFNNPNPENDNLKADYCKKLLDLNPMDPIVDSAWIRDQLGIKLPEIEIIDPLGPDYDPLLQEVRNGQPGKARSFQ